jgi:hypothetical protein
VAAQIMLRPRINLLAARVSVPCLHHRDSLAPGNNTLGNAGAAQTSKSYLQLTAIAWLTGRAICLRLARGLLDREQCGLLGCPGFSPPRTLGLVRLQWATQHADAVTPLPS